MRSRNYELSATLYDALHAGEVEKLARSLIPHLFASEVHKGATALDFGCGTGTLLGELQRYGIRGIGVDLSSEMVDLARSKHPSLEFVASDMCSLDLVREFDLVICTNDAINYLQPELRVAFFETAARHLNSGGMCYIDFDTETDITKCWDGQRSETAGSGWHLTRVHTYDPEMRLGTELQKWSVEGANGFFIFTESHILYPISPGEITELAHGAGLRVDQFIEPVEMRPLDRTPSSYLRLGCIIRWQ
jgi:SAM-dependent methyltransferase